MWISLARSFIAWRKSELTQANDRGLVVGVENVDAGVLVVDALVVALELAAARLALVDAVDRVVDPLARRDARPRPASPNEHPHLVERDGVERVADRARTTAKSSSLVTRTLCATLREA